MSLIAPQRLDAGGREIPVLHPPPGTALADYARAERDGLLALLAREGAVLLRGFAVGDLQAFDAFGAALSSQQLDYVYRSTPRTSAAGKVFTASEYPADQHIPLHNENAYQRAWPRRIAFYCRTPATQGGRTPFADMREVTAAIPPDLIAKFTALGVEYRRNYYSYMDIPWQTVFQTSDPAMVEAYCRDHGIEFAWGKRGALTTTQRCQGTAVHPETGELYFFNQAHLFHVSSLGDEAANMFIDSFGLAGVPRHARFGDGSEVSPTELEAVRTAFSQASRSFAWQAQDVLLLDNMRMAHGRDPFEGKREVFATLMDSHSPQASGETDERPHAASERA